MHAFGPLCRIFLWLPSHPIDGKIGPIKKDRERMKDEGPKKNTKGMMYNPTRCSLLDHNKAGYPSADNELEARSPTKVIILSSLFFLASYIASCQPSVVPPHETSPFRI